MLLSQIGTFGTLGSIFPADAEMLREPDRFGEKKRQFGVGNTFLSPPPRFLNVQTTKDCFTKWLKGRAIRLSVGLHVSLCVKTASYFGRYSKGRMPKDAQRRTS